MGTRKGYSKISAIPPSIMSRLNSGDEHSVTLSEGLAIDQALLWASLLPKIPVPADIDPTLGIVKRMKFYGEAVADWIDHEALQRCDTGRGWLCYAHNKIAIDLSDAIERIRPYASDSHFGVREWAWLAIRDRIVAEPIQAIELLSKWATDGDESIRRFACESLRPRGVWCAQIDLLKSEPGLAISVLEPLRSDPSKYVRLSVGNWLNDASKSNPNWVNDTTKRWLEQSSTKNTIEIVKRARRTLDKGD